MNKFKAFIGFLIIFNIIYFRFIHERLIGPINPQGTLWKISGILFILFIYIYLLFRLLKPYKNPNKILLKISKTYESMLIESYIIFTKFFEKKAILYTEYIEKTIIPFWCNIHRQKHIYLIFLCKYLIPLFIALVFVIEVYVYKEIKYFPRVLLLMCFNLLLDMIWVLGLHHVNASIRFHNEIFIITEDKEKTLFEINPNLSEEDYQLVGHKPHFDLLTKEYMRMKHEYLPDFLNYQHLCSTRINKHKNIYLTIRYIVWIIGWSTMLIYVLHNC